MSRYADLWPVVPEWVEWIATNADGTVVGWQFLPAPAPEGCWHLYCGKYYVLGYRAPTPDWRDSFERRPRPVNPTLCPHCGREI
jgi:hypothetical protein